MTMTKGDVFLNCETLVMRRFWDWGIDSNKFTGGELCRVWGW